MAKRLLLIIPLLIFIGLLLLFWRGLQLDKNILPTPLLNKPAPELVLDDLLTHGQVNLKDWRGQVVIVNVWATWCPGCLQEHETLNNIAASQVAPIIGLNYKDDLAKAKQWLKARGNPFVAIPVDVNGNTAIEWGVYGAPETFIIDKKGVIRYKHIAPLSWQEWSEVLLPIIEQLQGEA